MEKFMPTAAKLAQNEELDPQRRTSTSRHFEEELRQRVVGQDEAATNQDLNQMARDREFREDLYYRLNVFPIYLPPLRERKADIPKLVTHFVWHFAASMDKTIETIPEETLRALVRHRWPGNIRELQNYVERTTSRKAPSPATQDRGSNLVGPTRNDSVR